MKTQTKREWADAQTRQLCLTLHEIRLAGAALLTTADPQGRILGEKLLRLYRQEHGKEMKSWISRLWGRE